MLQVRRAWNGVPDDEWWESCVWAFGCALVQGGVREVQSACER